MKLPYRWSRFFDSFKGSTLRDWADYDRGYTYAARRLLLDRGVSPRLRNEAEGEYEPDSYHDQFNLGMRAAIEHFEQCLEGKTKR